VPCGFLWEKTTQTALYRSTPTVKLL